MHKTAAQGPQIEDEYLYKVVDALDEVAAETGKPLPQVALNWLLQRPTVSTVIVGARNETQLRQNLAAATWNLTPASSQTGRREQVTRALSLLAPEAIPCPEVVDYSLVSIKSVHGELI